MKKIPTLYKRDPDNRSKLLPEVHPDCQWVIDGEGVATVKLDGTCCKIAGDGRFLKRRELKFGKSIPDDFILEECDEYTGKMFGWVPVQYGSKQDKWHTEAWDRAELLNHHTPGTYELLGPKIQGNPEGLTEHRLVPHGETKLLEAPVEFDILKSYLSTFDIEGLVWHHPDGRMAKIKLKDVGIKRGANL